VIEKSHTRFMGLTFGWGFFFTTELQNIIAGNAFYT